MFGFTAAPCGRCAHGGSETYRRLFCGVSNRLRRDYGTLFRALVNRDATFLALVTEAQMPEPPAPKWETCCNPLARRRAISSQGPPADFAAAVTVCALEVKLADDASDERGPRRLLAKGVGPMARRAGEEARRQLDRLGFSWLPVLEALREQDAIERDLAGVRDGDLRAASDPTAFAFGEIFAFSPSAAGAGGSLRTNNEVALRNFGRALGRLVYWVDAREDLDVDRERGRFNPLLMDQSAQGAQDLEQILEAEALAASLAIEGTQFANQGSLVRELLSRSLLRNDVRAPQGLGAMTAPDPGAAQGEQDHTSGSREEKGRRQRWWETCDCCPADCCECCRMPRLCRPRKGECCDCDGDCPCECCGCDCG